MKVIGFERISFADSKDASKMVTGVMLYCANPIAVEKGEGFAYSKNGYERLFLSEWFLENRLSGEIPAVGSEVRVAYNRQGKLQEIISVPSK